MILYRASTQKTYYLNPRGFPIGIQLHEKDLFKKSIESDTIQLAEEDILLIYTDGITEAMNAKRDLFGEERLLKIFREHGQLRVNPFVEQIKEDILSFTEGTPQSDDITLVAIKERMSAPDLKIAAREKLLERVEVDRVPIEAACAELGVSPSTYYRYRRLRDQGGRDGLRDRRRRPLPTRLSNEQESVLLELVREDPERGAKRLAAVLSDRLGQEIKPGRVGGSLRRLKLSTRDERRVLAGQPPETPWRPRTQAESRKKREPRADRPAAPSPPDSGEAAGGEELEPTGT
jgi:transposase